MAAKAEEAPVQHEARVILKALQQVGQGPRVLDCGALHHHKLVSIEKACGVG